METVHTFCQTIDHANHKAAEDKSPRKALQVEFQQTQGHGRGCTNGAHGGCHGDGWGRSSTTGGNNASGGGRGRQSRRGGRTGGRYHNWIPREQFDALDDEGYARLIHDRVYRK